MTKPDFPDKARIRIDASTSKLFPVHSIVSFDRIEPNGPRVRLFIERGGGQPEHLCDADLPEIGVPDADAALRGKLDSSGPSLDLVITLCTGKEPDHLPRYFVGQVREKVGVDDPGGTGVWVSEAEPPKDPPDECT